MTVLRVLSSFMFAALALAAATAAAQPATAAAVRPVAAQSESGAGAGMSTDLFYRLLLGDVALQRGHPDVAARAYIDAAKEAKDPRLASRATEIAINSRQRPLVEEAATLWSKLDPTAERPKQVLAALAANGGHGDLPLSAGAEELRSRIEHVLSQAALSGQGVGPVFLQLNGLFAQQSDKRAVLDLIRDVAQPYPTSAEAHFAVALAAFVVRPGDEGTEAVAANEIDRALALKHDWDRAAVLKGEILARKSKAAQIAWLESFVAKDPSSKAANGALAQAYLGEKRYADARALMQKLWDRDPSAHELEFAVAAISLQMKDYPEAERLFTELKHAGYGEPGAMDLYLAQIAEEQKQYDKAIEHYRTVTDGDRAWLAKLRIGVMYGKEGKVEQAQQWLAGLDAVTPEQKIQVRQTQAQVLREAGDDAGAYRVLEKGLADHPDATDLIYDLAMVAEKLNRVDEAEARLKHLVELKPDDAQALNALGYTLVDRTPRTNEGYALIERAHKLSPEDPFILDSMGWALYRLGRLDEAEKYLQRALDDQPDPEIAAHLGEVLWRKGDRERARALWKEQLAAHPDNAVLKETIRRLEP
ncbi:MAG TPA: tetratricopeptide repeat protein [Casimicrobiaceae bacterium]|nr:tetratricopeptide repeat protein [Casimicrobiaceae bacterium]